MTRCYFKPVVLVIIIAAVVGAVNCGDETEDAVLLSTGNTQFTAKMLSEVAKKNPSKSFVLSAFSVLTPLAQLALAAEGKTHDELLTAIGLPDDQSIKSVFSYMKSKLQSIKGVDFKMASKIYIADRYALNDEFALVSKNVFRSEVKNVNFTRSKQAAEEINNWVEDQTNHRIKGLVSPTSLKPDTRLLLVNAVYFKGTWKHRFEKSLTRPHDFHLSRDKTLKVPTMYRKGNYYYGENEALDATVLLLPYIGDESAFYIILPNKVDGISALQNKLKDSSALENALRGLYDVEVEIYVPKFKIETTTNLKEILLNIGVESVFNTEANLTKLINNGHDLYVSEAVQKAFIEIHEEGAEAAAANKFDVANVSPVIHQPKTFVADHPFVYVLTIGRNIIFCGAFYQ